MAHTKKMLTEDWIKVKDNPIQRDTERHAAKAKHLLTPHPTHSIVHAAELPGGKLVKLDGHTRALMWRRKDIPAPMQVTVIVYPVKDLDEAEQLYKDFDSREALETLRDKISGAFNRHNFDPQSGLLQSGNITHAMRICYGVLMGMTVKGASSGPEGSAGGNTKRDKKHKVDVYEMVNEFSYELHMLDGYGLGQGQISSGLIAAFILSARRYGHKITPFWTGVFGDKGSKVDGQMDGIQAVNEMILARKGRYYGGSASSDMCARALNAVEKWLKDDLFYRVPTPMDTTGYLVGHEVPNERLIKKADLERARITREKASAHAV